MPPCSKREQFVEAVQEAICKLEDESKSLIGRVPGIAGPIADSISSLKDLVADCEGLPRIAVTGVTGVGKSTLINHLFGQTVAAVNATRSQTMQLQRFRFPPPDGNQLEICDTRGLGEILNSERAEAQLRADLQEDRPHVLAYMVDGNRKDSIDHEVKFVQSLLDDCKKKFRRDTALLVLMNRCDLISPSGFGNLPASPWETEQQSEPPIVTQKRRILHDKLRWLAGSMGTLYGGERTRVVPCALEWSEASRRAWNMAEVQASLNSIASLGLLLGIGDTVQTEDYLENLAQEIVFRFSIVASALCAVSLPLSDFLVLLPLQTAMVKVVKAFGSKGTLSTTGLLDAVGIVGIIGKLTAASLLKIVPGIGQATNASIAGVITYGLGTLAVRHFVRGEYPEASLIEDLGGSFLKLMERRGKPKS